MKRLVALALFGLSFNCFADRSGTEGITKTFDVDFEKVWAASLAALDDKTIETANKEVGQIITKAEKGTNILGNTSKTISVKVGHTRPCKVVVHSNVEKTVTVSGGFGQRSDTNTYSDDDQEKEIMASIEKNLAPPKKEASKN